ncbi:molybdopterin molybdotransferase MoeA, partial [Caldithrix abyssi]
MISIQEAMERIWARLPEKKKESLDISEATGRVLAHQVSAAEPSPRFTNSAMDGMAVRFEDLQSLPVELSIVGESRAGGPFQGVVQNGQAVRISTGAVLPQGADTVIPIEDCQVEQSRVKILTAKKKGANVRKKGEEFETGEVLLRAGTTLFPEHLALLAAQGIQRVEVYARPRVVLLTTGSEVKSFKEEIADYEIRDSNLLMLGEAIKLAGGELMVSDRLPDDFSLTVQKLNEAQNKADVIVLSGGVSVGPHDHVKKAAAEAGFR